MKLHGQVKRDKTSTDVPWWAASGFLVGAASALLGGYWDDAWHTVEGRDAAFIAPHIAIYSGIALAGGSLGCWAALVAVRRGIRTMLRNGPLLTALLAVALTLLSAPIDNAWHLAFGRDSVIWSPPHLLGIVGAMGLAVGMLAALRASSSPWAQRLGDPAGGLVIASAVFVVVEYDTDVPQFSYLWYLPVLALAAGFALSVVRVLSGTRFAATRAALWHLGFVTIVSAFLLARGYDAVRVPVLVFPALALDIATRRGSGALSRSALVAAGIAIPSFLLLRYAGASGLQSPAQVLVSAALALVAVLITTSAVLGSRASVTPARARRASGVAVLVLALTALTATVAAPPADAHDPGQGTGAGTIDLLVRADRRAITMTARRGPSTSRSMRFSLVARRGGTVRAAALERAADGALTGTVEVDADGRWFVYLEARDRHRRLESWLPVTVGDGSRETREARRFVYVVKETSATGVKTFAGVVLYGVAAAFLAALALLVRRSSRVEPSRAGDG